MNPNVLFVYGILKRGFQLDLEQRGAKFLGEAQLPGAILYRIGHGGVGLRLVEDLNKVAYGEVFEIPHCRPDRYAEWGWLDEIENNGLVYTRKVVPVHFPKSNADLLTWVYEHTYPSARYDRPIESG